MGSSRTLLPKSRERVGMGQAGRDRPMEIFESGAHRVGGEGRAAILGGVVSAGTWS